MFLNLYKGIVKPPSRVRYICVVATIQKDAITIENVQRRATELLPCLKNKTCSERLKFLAFPSLEYRRERADMIRVYKILNDIDKVNKDKLFTMSHNIGTRGHRFKIYKNRYRLNVRGNYFSNRVINLWNELPENSYGTHSQQLQKQTKQMLVWASPQV